MYDRKNEFDHFFEEVHFEQEKNDISRIAKTVKRKARVHTAMISIRNFIFAIIFLSSITVIGVNTSPAIARTLAKIPIIGEWIEGAAEDEGIQEALKNDCETVVNQTRKVKGGSITLSYCIADESNFVFSVSGDFTDDEEGTQMKVIVIRVVLLVQKNIRVVSMRLMIGFLRRKQNINGIFQGRFD